MNIKTVIIPWKNQKDLMEIPEELKQKLNFVAVKTIDEVLEVAIVGWKEWSSDMTTLPSKRVGKKVGNLPPVAA